MAPDDLMGDPGPAEAMVRRAVEEEREWILAAVRQLGQTGAISLHAAHRVADTIRRRGA